MPSARWPPSAASRCSAALAAGFGGKVAVLSKTSLFAWYTGPAAPGDLPAPVRLHGGKPSAARPTDLVVGCLHSDRSSGNTKTATRPVNCPDATGLRWLSRCRRHSRVAMASLRYRNPPVSLDRGLGRIAERWARTPEWLLFLALAEVLAACSSASPSVRSRLSSNTAS